MAYQTSYKKGSWGKFLSGYFGSMGVQSFFPGGWGGSLIGGALLSSSQDPRLRSVGNGILWGVGTTTALGVLAAGAMLSVPGGWVLVSNPRELIKTIFENSSTRPNRSERADRPNESGAPALSMLSRPPIYLPTLPR